MSTVTIYVDPASALSAPQTSRGAASAMENLRSQCGLLGAMDGVIAGITGFSPLQEWVFKPLTGDWAALDRGSQAWANAAKAAQALSDGIATFPAQVGDDWQGAAALRWASANGKLVGELEGLPAQCQHLSAMCEALSEAAQELAGFIAALLDQLSQDVIEMLAQLAIPIEGEIAAAAYTTKIGIEVAEGAAKVGTEISKFAQLVQKLLKIVEQIQSILEKVGKIAGALDKGLQAVQVVGNLGTAAVEGEQASGRNPGGLAVGAANAWENGGRDGVSHARKIVGSVEKLGEAASKQEEPSRGSEPAHSSAGHVREGRR